MIWKTTSSQQKFVFFSFLIKSSSRTAGRCKRLEDCVSISVRASACVCVCLWSIWQSAGVHKGQYRTSLSGGFMCFWFLVMLRQWGRLSDLILNLLIKLSSQLFSSRSPCSITAVYSGLYLFLRAPAIPVLTLHILLFALCPFLILISSITCLYSKPLLHSALIFSAVIVYNPWESIWVQ